VKSVSKKSSYHHGDLRQALIDGAIALIAEHNVDSISLREVARQAGVSHTAPYRHFADKEALLAVVAEEGFMGLAQALRHSIALNSSNSFSQLEACGIAYVEYAIAHPSHYRVMFGIHRGKSDRFLESHRVSKEAFGVLETIISEGQTAGAFRSGIPHQLAWVVWSLMHGLVMLLIDKQISIEEMGNEVGLVKFMTQCLLKGLAVVQ
jgi:AcrR family transcriptional regulator